jgi:hypothetical protein
MEAFRSVTSLPATAGLRGRNFHGDDVRDLPQKVRGAVFFRNRIAFAGS